MYNLFVSGYREQWDGEDFLVEETRCVNEYTAQGIRDSLGSLDADAISKLKRLPCIFACEDGRDRVPKFGRIRDVVKRQGQVRVSYDIEPVTPFLSQENFQSLAFNLDIGKWEMNRTHWAVKDVNLARELSALNITLPSWANVRDNSVNISTHMFDVALSFPGDLRPVVESVARELERRIGPNAYFYDNNYTAQLARPSLDTFLQDLYRNRSRLIVIFLSSGYERRRWCGIEFRAIREIIHDRNHERIMYIRMDDGEVEGVFSTDGFIDGRQYAPDQIASFIEERVNLLG